MLQMGASAHRKREAAKAEKRGAARALAQDQGSACDIDWENHREDESESDAIVRSLGNYTAERPALESRKHDRGSPQLLCRKRLRELENIIRALRRNPAV
jgi:hypothetical protein